MYVRTDGRTYTLPVKVELPELIEYRPREATRRPQRADAIFSLYLILFIDYTYLLSTVVVRHFYSFLDLF